MSHCETLAEKEAPSEDTRAEGDADLQSLQKTVTALQSSLDGAFKGLSSNLQQSVQLMQTMNQVMELFLCASLSLGIAVSYEEDSGSAVATVTVANKCQFPLQNLSVSFTLHPRDASHVIIPDSLLRLLPKNEPEDGKPNSGSLALPPFDLAPFSQRILKVQISLRVPQQGNVHVVISFPSPGSGSILKKDALFGVYLADQLSAQHVKNTDDLHLSEQLPAATEPVVIAAATFRQLFRVKPASGLSASTFFKMEHPASGSLLLCIKDVDPEGVLLTVECSRSAGMAESFANLLIAELRTMVV